MAEIKYKDIIIKIIGNITQMQKYTFSGRMHEARTDWVPILI